MMKPISLLILGISPALGGELIHHLHHPGYCNSPLLGTFPHLSNPICSHDTLLTKYQAPSRSSPAHRAWDRVSSCYQNGTQEYCVFASTQFAEGRGISVITSPERAEYMANLAAFAIPNITKGFNQDLVPDRPKKYKLVHVPGKDIGVVATQPLHRGDHIMSNTASVIVDYGAFENVPNQDILRLQADAVDFLPTLHRSRFMNLSTHDGVEGHLKRVEKILATNAFDVELEDDTQDGLYLVFPEIARFNHDCRPNADYYFDPDTLSQHIHAIRPIAAGEEISITYIDPLKSRAKRTKKLHSVWGFHCSCSQCTRSAPITAASDARIAEIHELREHLSDYSAESAATPQMADLFISLYEQERMQSTIYEAYTFAAIEWNGVGEPWTAVKYARLAVEYGLPSVGPRDRDVIEMRALAEDPWGHWSWMLRTSKRMGWEAMRPIGASYMRGGDDEEED